MLKHNITIFLSLFVLLLGFSSCNSTKYVPQNKLLLTENIIEINDGENDTGDITPYLIQRPNTRFLWIPFKLGIYNWHDENYKEKWGNKLIKLRDSSSFFTPIFSLKQAVIYTNFRKKINERLIKNGESPVILNLSKTKKTLTKLKLHYTSEGYFKAKIQYKIDSISSNKAKVTYFINTGKQTKIDSIKVRIASPVIDSLYQLHWEKSLIKPGQAYRRQNFEDEATRLITLFRNAGVYHFSKYAINFFEIDSANTNQKTHVILDISDRLIDKGDSITRVPFEIFKIKQVRVITDYSYSKKDFPIKDSLHHNGIDFFAYDKINYRVKHLSKAIFITPGQKYSDINTTLTRKHLRELTGFKSIRISFEETGNEQLTATIFLTPFERLAFKTDAEITTEDTKPFGISGKISFKNKNTFKANEVFQFGLQGSFLNSSDLTNSEQYLLGLNAWEWGADASFKIPRIYIPFAKENYIDSKMSPSTTFSVGYGSQKNISLDKQRFTGIAKYNWKSSPKNKHSIEVLNAQYIRNLNVGSFFDIYTSERRKLDKINVTHFDNQAIDDYYSFMQTALADTDFHNNNSGINGDYRIVQNINKRYKIITEDVLVPAITYQFIHNTQTSFTDADYSYFKAGIASAGLLSTLFAKGTNPDEPKQLFDTNVAQYIKLDLEFKKNWDLNYQNIIAFRTSMGIAIPYGNSTSIPFSRSYFIGGPNDLRAWKIYELGPGKENEGLEFNVGNFKLLSSLEYRFNIINSLKGALFIDAGNIWDISNSELTSDDAKFNSFSSLKNTAVGSGFGLRYDLSFLVLRGDLGFKTYIPYEIGRKWFVKDQMTPVINIGINYPF